jgi:hypothetical protein
MLYQQTKALAEKIVAAIQPHLWPLDVSDPEYAYKTSMAFFLGKALKTYQAIHLLTEAGYGQDAAILARTLFELTLQVQYIAADSKRAELFVKHDPVERYYSYLKLTGDPALLAGMEHREAELAALKAQFDQLETDYIRNKGWWGSDVRSLAKELNAEASYLRVYPLYSPLVHTTSSSVKHYIKQVGDQILIDCGPSDKGKELAPFSLCTAFLLIIAHVATCAWELAPEAAEAMTLAKKVG